MEIKYRKPREFEILANAADVIEMLRSQFSTRKLFLKDVHEKLTIAIMEYRDDNTIIIQADSPLNLGPEIHLYGLSDRYLEVDLGVMEAQGSGYYHCSIATARRAITGRRDLRFKLPSDEVIATNFRISKYTIDVSAHNMPTSIKVVLDQFHNKYYKLSDLVKVDVFSADTNNLILDKIRKTGKALFVPDVSNPDSYKALTPDFIDLNELYGNDVSSISKNYVTKGYKSIIIVPIIYLNDIEESIPFAYIQLISKTVNFDIDKVLEVKDLSFKLIDRIREANTLLVTVHQRIVDISKGGAKLCITDDNLKKSILKSRGFVFDIVFKLQAPITMYGEIRATYIEDNNSLMVGVDFGGNSSRKGELKRFQSILKPKEMEYKAKLLQTIKKK